MKGFFAFVFATLLASLQSFVLATLNSNICGTRPLMRADDDPSKILDGQVAQVGDHPWQLALYNKGRYMCGATIIDDRWVLSSARCISTSK